MKYICTNRKGSVIVDFSLWVEDSVELNTLKDIFMRQSQFMIEHEVVDLQSLRLAGKLSNKLVKFPAVQPLKRLFWRIVYFRLSWGTLVAYLKLNHEITYMFVFIAALTGVHNTTQHNTTQHNTTQHNTTQHNTTQHNTTQHNTTQHNTTQHNTTQHNTTQQHNTTRHIVATNDIVHAIKNEMFTQVYVYVIK